MDLAVVPAAPDLPAGGPVAAADRPLITYYDDATGERTELTAEVRDYPAGAPAYQLVRGVDAATVDGTTYQQWATVAYEVAGSWSLRPGDRVLIDAAEHEQPVRWLLAPMSVGASVVLCANLDPAAVASRVAAEQVTRVL